jgi:hypothetical protein
MTHDMPTLFSWYSRMIDGVAAPMALRSMYMRKAMKKVKPKTSYRTRAAGRAFFKLRTRLIVPSSCIMLHGILSQKSVPAKL